MRAGVPPRPPSADLPRDAGGAPDRERLAGPRARGGACWRGQVGTLKPGPAGRAGRGRRRGSWRRPLPVRCIWAPLPLPAPHTCRRGQGGGAGQRGGGPPKWVSGRHQRWHRAQRVAHGELRARAPHGAASGSAALPQSRKLAPSRPFERWILLTYLAALASRAESWVLPDRVGLAFVTLGQPLILLEPGECA